MKGVNVSFKSRLHIVLNYLIINLYKNDLDEGTICDKTISYLVLGCVSIVQPEIFAWEDLTCDGINPEGLPGKTT